MAVVTICSDFVLDNDIKSFISQKNKIVRNNIFFPGWTIYFNTSLLILFSDEVKHSVVSAMKGVLKNVHFRWAPEWSFTPLVLEQRSRDVPLYSHLLLIILGSLMRLGFRDVPLSLENCMDRGAWRATVHGVWCDWMTEHAWCI